MDKINSKSNNYSTKFKGVNKMEDKAVQSLENYTKGVINKLSQRVEKEVADYSNYVPASIEERFGKKLPNITYAQELILRVRPLPNELKDTTPNFDSLRWLEAVAVGQGGVEAASVLKRGTKDEILKVLNDNSFQKRLLEKFESLDIDLHSN